MLTKTITYENFNGEMVTQNFHFHLSKAELVKANIDGKGSIGDSIRTIQDTGDMLERIAAFERIIAMAVGEKLENGNFRKNDQVRSNFMDSGAYDEFFMEMMQNASLAAEFIKGVMPPSLLSQIDPKELAKIDKLVDEHTKLLAGESSGFDVASKTESAGVVTITGLEQFNGPMDASIPITNKLIEHAKDQDRKTYLDSQDNIIKGLDATKQLGDYTELELLSMPQSHFDFVAGKDPKVWPQKVLQIAYQRKMNP